VTCNVTRHTGDMTHHMCLCDMTRRTCDMTRVLPDPFLRVTGKFRVFFFFAMTGKSRALCVRVLLCHTTKRIMVFILHA